MRSAIINHLKSNVPLVEGRVYQPFMAPKNMKEPYLVVTHNGDIRDVAHMHAFEEYVDIWPYTVPDNFTDIDSMTTQIVAAMQLPIFTSAGEISLAYQGSGTDFYDEEIKLITNGPIEFQIHTIKELRR